MLDQRDAGQTATGGAVGCKSTVTNTYVTPDSAHITILREQGRSLGT